MKFCFISIAGAVLSGSTIVERMTYRVGEKFLVIEKRVLEIIIIFMMSMVSWCINKYGLPLIRVKISLKTNQRNY